MCGIAGIFDANLTMAADIDENVLAMADALAHRGPDSEGAWSDRSSGLAMAHRRLSILDLSEAGHQPMLSHCERYVLSFNGEIYNHLELRRELEINGYIASSDGWVGQSDTETLLAGIEFWGLAQTLKKASGMFALALWDRKEKALFLCRDRMGEKPLYYGFSRNIFLFSSELKAIKKYPTFTSELDPISVQQYLTFNYVPAPKSIYKGISKLLPGSILKITKEDVLKLSLRNSEQYWNLEAKAISGQQNLFEGSVEDAKDELNKLLMESVSQQMISDVPIGAFLSGGIDSTAVVAMMQQKSSNPVNTFTIGFEEDGYNEAKQARSIASYLGTKHTEFYVQPEQALGVIPKLAELYDEPFADASQIPTFLVSQLAKNDVTVCLSGDGGDELFGGYNRHVFGTKFGNFFQNFPIGFRNILSDILGHISISNWKRLFRIYCLLAPYKWRFRTPEDKIEKLIYLLQSRSVDEVYHRLISHQHDFKHPTNYEAHCLPYSLTEQSKEILSRLENQMMLLDSCTYLPDNILAKVDRAAMGVSLETRMPMLNHKLIEFSWRIPIEMKIKDDQGKWLLREVLYDHVPKSLISSPKSGFSIPLASWLRDPLKDWCNDMLRSSNTIAGEYLETNYIDQIINEHFSGQKNRGDQLWNLVMLQSWFEKN